tara:strand:- start:178 stop:915 length:738 start_codon:yes stop_codon:yes gene_type:complete
MILDKNKIPTHVAIIMDGNGRWAKSKKLPRVSGHKAGVKAVREIVKSCSKIGIEHLTLFTFSSENWKRPSMEVNALMKLLLNSIRDELKSLIENNVRFTCIGNISEFNDSIQNELFHACEKTKNNSGLNLNLALSYGGRQEILNATKQLIHKVNSGQIKIDNINESTFSKELYTKGLPNPDLLIRTGGNYRISNFLLWQVAYSEFYITDTFWPAFNEDNLIKAILDFQKRERRFGKISEQAINND